MSQVQVFGTKEKIKEMSAEVRDAPLAALEAVL